MTVKKTKPKPLFRRITTGTNSTMNQPQFLAITCNSLEPREMSRVQGGIGFGFGFASHSLKYWRESFQPITKRSSRNRVITFDSHLKTALNLINTVQRGFSGPKKTNETDPTSFLESQWAEAKPCFYARSCVLCMIVELAS